MRSIPPSLPLGLLLLGATACEKPAAPPPEAPPIEVTLTDYAFTAPDSLPSGWTTFQAVNRGTQLHHALLVRLDSNRTVNDLMAALGKQGPPPSWMVAEGGLQNASRVTVQLTPGNYAWLCVIPGPDGAPHFVHGMVRGFVVTDSANGRPAPAADIDVTARDYTWEFSKPLTAGKHTLKVTVAPGQPHEFVLIRLPAGKRAQDVVDWLAKPEGPPPAESIEGTGAAVAGVANFEEVNLVPGTYAILCFLPDATDGQQHLRHGMMQEVTVAGS